FDIYGSLVFLTWAEAFRPRFRYLRLSCVFFVSSKYHVFLLFPRSPVSSPLFFFSRPLLVRLGSLHPETAHGASLSHSFFAKTSKTDLPQEEIAPSASKRFSRSRPPLPFGKAPQTRSCAEKHLEK
ncbi:unnamed protein product, partial [Scytosiphon promiscuus]